MNALAGERDHVSQTSFGMSGSYELTLKLASSSLGTSARCLCIVSTDLKTASYLLNMAAMKMSLMGTFAPSASPLLRAPVKLPGKWALHCTPVCIEDHRAGSPHCLAAF